MFLNCIKQSTLNCDIYILFNISPLLCSLKIYYLGIYIDTNKDFINLCDIINYSYSMLSE